MNPIFYILLRTDIPSMNFGKGAAQASHAANALESYIKECNESIRVSFKQWKSDTHQGFGTCIVLGASGKEIDNIFSNQFDPDDKLAAERIYDPTYPFFVVNEVAELLMDSGSVEVTKTVVDGKTLCLRNEMTCAYIFGEKEDVAPFISSLKLHP